ncbi:TonB-dependent receptor plug domain-containing protein [Chitinophaga deserti]|uniref:TonB-dependent receptor plug domain-containing protein n=1 Tax=Chitinophaga deserti TaxID=2164099 RepID=UPI000D6CD9B2|nr:TonB-dependent receptor [Chitinophaga deserti]
MRIFYVVLLTVLSLQTYAQQRRDSVISIQEVVINENRFSTPISRQNRNVYVIDKATIAKLPARSLQEILQYANGVDIRQRGPFGSQADISIDGGSFEQTVVLVNGTKIIDNQTAHNMLNLPIPVEAIERIEVIRGPAARIYGINSLTGAVNIITKKPEQSGFLVSAFGGSNFEKDTAGTGEMFYGTGIQLGGVISKAKHQHSLFGSYDKSNGYRYNTQFENKKLFYQGNYQINNANEILTSAGYIDNGFGANGFYAAPGDKNSTEAMKTVIASIQSKHTLSDRFSLMSRVSYRYNDDDYRYFGVTNPNAGKSRHYTNSLAAELNSTYRLHTGELGFGVEGRREDINSSNIGDHRRENLGLYAQYRVYLLDNKLDVNAGTYVNYNSDYKWQIYPGLDASYAISKAFRITGNVGTSQRIPSFTDLFLNQRPGNIGNPDLSPEDALQGELGFKFLHRNLTVNASYFYRNISSFIDWTRMVTTEPWQSNNVGDLRTKGFNVRSDYRVAVSEKAKFNIHLAYTYLDSESEGAKALYSKYLISSLKHQVTNTVEFSYSGFSVLVATRYNDRISGKSYFINDFRISQRIQHFTVMVDAQNIFNSKYNEIGAIPLPARWFSLGVKYTNL